MISDAVNADAVYFQGEVCIGDTIKVENPDCLPAGLLATTGVPVSTLCLFVVWWCQVGALESCSLLFNIHVCFEIYLNDA